MKRLTESVKKLVEVLKHPNSSEEQINESISNYYALVSGTINFSHSLIL